MKSLKLLVLFFISLLLFGCGEPPCPDDPEAVRPDYCPEESIYTGKYLLPESIRSFFPFEDHSKVIFMDSKSIEYAYSLSGGKIELLAKEISQKCTETLCHQYMTQINYDVEKYEILMNCEALDHEILLIGYPNIEHDMECAFVQNTLLVKSRVGDELDKKALRMRTCKWNNTNYRIGFCGDDGLLSFHNSIHINNKLFFDVWSYEHQDDYFLNSDHKVYLNNEYGLVGIISPDSSLILSFNRFE